MAKKRASTTIYFIFFFVMFLAFSAFAVDATITLTNRAKLQNITESAVLAGASEFVGNSGNVSATATSVFNFLKSDSLADATIVGAPQANNRKILLRTQYISRPYFLAFLGVTGIKLEATACAQSEEKDVTTTYPGVNWVSDTGSFKSDIISITNDFKDTAILLPLGDFESASFNKTTLLNYFTFINTKNNIPLNLGPGGYITIKLPVPIIDKPGNDLHIEEIGYAQEGYMVFAGMDNEPATTTNDASKGPYVNASKPHAGITWINIANAALNNSGTGLCATSNIGSQAKIYGSSDFDLSKISNLSTVKYIRIVDDNEESGYINGTLYTNLYGEASTVTAGADIDYVRVLNHVKLIDPETF